MFVWGNKNLAPIVAWPDVLRDAPPAPTPAGTSSHIASGSVASLTLPSLNPALGSVPVVGATHHAR
jgi:hypothetical protein